MPTSSPNPGTAPTDNANSFHLSHFLSQSKPIHPPLVLFFITGNPGLVAYYNAFLTLCFDALRARYGELRGVCVAGCGLAGFVNEADDEFVEERGSGTGSGDGRDGRAGGSGVGVGVGVGIGVGVGGGGKAQCKGPYDLKQQIQYIEQRLSAAVARCCTEPRNTTGTTPSPSTEAQSPKAQEAPHSVEVVLVGHSVGAYVLLEVVRRRQERLLQRVRDGCGGSAGSAGINGRRDGESEVRGRGGGDEAVLLSAGVCLFPTVTHIARSDSGRRFTPLLNIPYFAHGTNLLARALFSWLPLPLLQRLVGIVTGFPPEPASATAKFLQSRSGVLQALFLAGDEMRSITEDSWGEELWGVVGAGGAGDQGSGAGGKMPLPPPPRLFFLFGTGDHWVADETRDELIAARAATGRDGEGQGPRMEIDESGVPHSFCIKHNEQVAKKVVEYVAEVLKGR